MPLFRDVHYFVNFLFQTYKINFQSFELLSDIFCFFQRCAESTLISILSVSDILDVEISSVCNLCAVGFGLAPNFPISNRTPISTSIRFISYLTSFRSSVSSSYIGLVIMPSDSHNSETIRMKHTHLINNMSSPDIVMSSSKLFLSDILSIPENSSDGDQCGVSYFDAIAFLRSVFKILLLLLLLLLLLARCELYAETSWL
jgi:hypothetical protein